MGDGRFTQDAGGAGGDRLVDELVPVGYLALHRDEKVALRHLARVEGNALYGEVSAGGASASRRDGVRGPQCAPAAVSRATVTSAKGMTRVALHGQSEEHRDETHSIMS